MREGLTLGRVEKLIDLLVDISSILQGRILSEESSPVNGAQVFNGDQSGGEIELDDDANDPHHSLLTLGIAEVITRSVAGLDVEKDIFLGKLG